MTYLVLLRRTASRLNRIMASPLYRSMTIRRWYATLPLRDLMRARAKKGAAS